MQLWFAIDDSVIGYTTGQRTKGTIDSDWSFTGGESHAFSLGEESVTDTESSVLTWSSEARFLTLIGEDGNRTSIAADDFLHPECKFFRVAQDPETGLVLVVSTFEEPARSPAIPFLRSVFDYFDVDQPKPESFQTTVSIVDLVSLNKTEVRRRQGWNTISDVAFRDDRISFVVTPPFEKVKVTTRPGPDLAQSTMLETWWVPHHQLSWLPWLAAGLVGGLVFCLPSRLRRRRR